MEKLIKSVNALKFHYGGLIAEEKNQKDAANNPKERQVHLNSIAECLTSSSLRGSSDLPGLLTISIEILLQACTDESADVRLNADESLNKVIKSLHETSMSKILVELYKDIKKDGHARSLRASLHKFACLCYNIRPGKCRAFILNILPCLSRISQREEESLQECLATSTPKIFAVLGQFVSESEVQGLIASFLKNLSSKSVTLRRSAGTCLYAIVVNSRNKESMLNPLLRSIQDIITQRHTNRSTVLGCLQTLRILIPLISARQSPSTLLIKTFEMSVYYLCNNDHTIVTSALELLEQLLGNFIELLSRDLSRQTFTIEQANGDEKSIVSTISTSSSLTNISEDASMLESDGNDEISNNGKVLENGEATTTEVESNVGEETRFVPLGFDDIFDNSQPTLKTLARIICQRFLLALNAGTLISGSKVRVSSKNLALICLSIIVKLHPSIIRESILSTVDEQSSHFRDVFEYCKHEDPQLRGAVLSVAAAYLTTNKPSDKEVSDLCGMMLTALSDKSSGTIRQACSSISQCLPSLLNRSEHTNHCMELLKEVLSLQHNSYWLIQTDLLELLASLNFRQLSHLESQNGSLKTSIQSKSLHIALKCLQDEDSRIRRSSSDALVAMVTGLHPGADPVSEEASQLCRNQLGLLCRGRGESPSESDRGSAKSMLKVYRGYETQNGVDEFMNGLTLVIHEVSSLLCSTTSKSSTSGCLLALSKLSGAFPVCEYPLAWGCNFTRCSEAEHRLRFGRNSPRQENQKIQQLGILPIVMDLLKASWIQLDLQAHSDCLRLAGNLIAGAASHEYTHLVGAEEGSDPTSDERKGSSTSQQWSSVKDAKLSMYTGQLFLHLVKLLSIQHHVITETTPSSNKSVLPNLSSNASLPSPIKRKDKKDQSGAATPTKSSPIISRKILPTSPLTKTTSAKDVLDVEKEKPSKKTLGNFHQSRPLMKLYEQLNGAFKNYKGSLEFGSSDRLCAFIHATLDVTCQITELASFPDVANNTEEVLGYLKSTFALQPSITVLCIQQLLKALFGTNLVSQRETMDNITSQKRNNADHNSAFYHKVFHHPLNHLTMSIANASFHNSLQSQSTSKDSDGWFGSIKKKMEKKLTRASKLAKNNKSSIQNYIRLFEGLVIRSLKIYTTTSDVRFQKEVLNLLAQLVQLRVNYCMLDSDLVFITFIIKQFETIETGLVRESEVLVPHIFFFLVLLSYECYQSKTVITMSKIIQLCDGLMAGGQGSVTHVIPALQPIVHDLFVVKVSSSKLDDVHVTQREVVQFTMLRLLQHPQVFEMLTTILLHQRRENVTAWKQLSNQVVDILIPHLNNFQIQFSAHCDVNNLHCLFESLSPASIRPCDVIVENLFSDPCAKVNLVGWTGKVLVLLRLLICHFTEDDVLKSIQDRGIVSVGNSPAAEVAESSKPEMIIARFFHNLLSKVAASLSSSNNLLLCQHGAELLLYLTYIHRSGAFRRVTSASRELLLAPPSSQPELLLAPPSSHHEIFRSLSSNFPILTITWLQFVTYLDAVELNAWMHFAGNGGESETINNTIVRRASIILLADYAFYLDPTNRAKASKPDVPYTCQNVQHCDLVNWLIDNHVYDVIKLQGEPPVQDFLSSIKENSQASNKFIQAITNIPKYNLEPRVIHGILHCVGRLPVDCSPGVLHLLVADNYIFSARLSLAQMCDHTCCQVVEQLLGNPQLNLLKLEDLDRLLTLLSRGPRYARLHTLLKKLRSSMTDQACKVIDQSQPTIEQIEEPHKSWFKSVVLSCCHGNGWTPECAKALAKADYDDIVEVMSSEDFQASHLHSCLSLGLRAASTPPQVSPQGVSRDVQDGALLAAGLHLVAKRLQRVTDQIVQDPDPPHNDELIDQMFGLCKSLLLCLKYHELVSHQIDASFHSNCVKVALQMCKVLDSKLVAGNSLSLSMVYDCFELLQECFTHNDTRPTIASSVQYVSCVAQTTFKVVQHYVGEIPLHKPFVAQSTSRADSLLEEGVSPLSACVRTSQLVYLLRDDSSHALRCLTTRVARAVRNLVLDVCRCQPINSYVRIPRQLWKFGWEPALSDEPGFRYPDPPAEFLQEKEVLSDFIAVNNFIGWTSRTQFEETWASLLGVLVSMTTEADREDSQNEDSVEISRLAIRGLTSLVTNCSLTPHSGQPSTGRFKVHHRLSTLKLAHVRAGRQLLRVRGILDEELSTLIGFNQQYDLSKDSSKPETSEWMFGNIESQPWRYNVPQVSVQAFQDEYGIQPLRDDVSMTSSDDESSALFSSEADQSLGGADESDPIDVFEEQLSNQQSSPQNHVTLSPLRVRDGVDVHSCVQFLLDLYTEWFRSAAQANQQTQSSVVAPPSPLSRPIICESVRSLLLVSDLFTERQQFEWMFSTLAELASWQGTEDEVMLQYLVIALSKSASVLGLGSEKVEAILKLLEPSISNSAIWCRVAALQATLYCLERCPSNHVKAVVDLVAEVVPAQFVAATTSRETCNDDYVILLTSVAFYVIEKCPQMVAPEFTTVITQAAVLFLTSSEVTSSRVFHAVSRGLERLVLAFALPSSECEAVLKSSVEQLTRSEVSDRTISSCALMLTCMYCERMRRSNDLDKAEDESSLESGLLAMERVSLLFERVRRGFERDARVMTKILPYLLDDFFPPQDVMNKVIAEFNSTFQPFPNLIAEVVYDVFQTLHNRDQSQMVQSWVMLSLGNVIQRTPLSTAVWCLTCLFACASTNHWINSLVPIITCRLKRPQPRLETNLFCKAAIDFFKFQLVEELDRRSFHATFSSAASSLGGDSNPYKLLLDCLGQLTGATGIL